MVADQSCLSIPQNSLSKDWKRKHKKLSVCNKQVNGLHFQGFSSGQEWVSADPDNEVGSRQVSLQSEEHGPDGPPSSVSISV